MAPNATIGVYGAAYRQKARFRDDDYDYQVGPFTQVSRLGNPLFNEVIVPMGRKDEWNRKPPHRDNEFAKYVARPELGQLLPVLYPGVFPNLAALTPTSRPGRPAGDPADRHPGRDHPRVPELHRDRRRPTCCGSTWRSRRAPARNVNGILGGDLAGFPNGRRVFDDIVTIELRAVAGADHPARRPDVHARRGGRR